MTIGSVSSRSAITASAVPASVEARPVEADHGQQNRASTEMSNYLSPMVKLQSGVAVLQVRDRDTGDVLVQFPAEKVVRSYIEHGGEGAEQPVARAVTVAPRSGDTDAKAPEPALQPAQSAPASESGEGQKGHVSVLA